MEKKGRNFGGLPEHTSRSLALIPGFDNQEVSCIPRGTTGFVMNDKKPFVVMWEHPHSTLRYLSQVLSTAPITSNRMVVGELDSSASDLQTDIIELIATRLHASLSMTSKNSPQAVGIAAAHRVLEEASDSLDRNEDIVTLVATIF